MIAPDVNLLVYAYEPTSPFHRQSRAWWEELLSSDEPVGIPVPCLHGFLRFMTNFRIAQNPLRFEQAAVVVNSWLEQPRRCPCCHSL
jgi:predicted nucleic acid-binding protein